MVEASEENLSAMCVGGPWHGVFVKIQHHTLEVPLYRISSFSSENEHLNHARCVYRVQRFFEKDRIEMFFYVDQSLNLFDSIKMTRDLLDIRAGIAACLRVSENRPEKS